MLPYKGSTFCLSFNIIWMWKDFINQGFCISTANDTLYSLFLVPWIAHSHGVVVFLQIIRLENTFVSHFSPSYFYDFNFVTSFVLLLLLGLETDLCWYSCWSRGDLTKVIYEDSWSRVRYFKYQMWMQSSWVWIFASLCYINLDKSYQFYFSFHFFKLKIILRNG